MGLSTTRKENIFLNNFLSLVMGTTFSQIIIILFAPILTRLYGPESFGLLTIFISITSILNILVCLRYESSILLSETDEGALNLFILCLILTALTTFIITVVLTFGQSQILNLLNAPQFAPFLWLLPISMIIAGISLPLMNWTIRKKRFKQLAISRVIGSVTTTGSQLYAGFSGFQSGGSLIVSSIIGQFISVIILGKFIFSDIKEFLSQRFNYLNISFGFKRYRNFLLYDTQAEFLNTISWQLPIFFLSSFFSPIIVGFYGLGLRVLQMPMSLVGGAISQVFFPRAVEARSDGSIGKLVEDFFRVLVAIGMFPLLLLSLTGGDIFLIIFGEQWYEAGIYAQILSIWAFFWFISSPLSTLYYVYEKQKAYLRFTIANFITRFLSLLIGGLLNNIFLALGLFAISGIFVYGYLSTEVMKYSNVSFVNIKSILTSNFLLFLPFGLVIIVLKLIKFSSLVIFLVSLLLGIIYYLYIIRKNKQIRDIVSRIPIFQILFDKKIL